jgi:hypothetical protein
VDKRALSLYQEWNESRFIESVLSAGTKSSEERWKEFKELTALCWKLKPEQSRIQQQVEMEAWELYFETVKKFERKRNHHGEGSPVSSS